MSTTTPTTPTERLARFERARQLATGEVRIGLACPQCGARNLQTDDVEVRCLNGHPTTERRVHTHRRQCINRFLRTGTIAYGPR